MLCFQDPKAKYEFLDQLSHAGADSADIVYRVRDRKTSQSYACKRISKHQMDYAGSCLRYTHPCGLHQVVICFLDKSWDHEGVNVGVCGSRGSLGRMFASASTLPKKLFEHQVDPLCQASMSGCIPQQI